MHSQVNDQHFCSKCIQIHRYFVQLNKDKMNETMTYFDYLDSTAAAAPMSMTAAPMSMATAPMSMTTAAALFFDDLLNNKNLIKQMWY